MVFNQCAASILELWCDKSFKNCINIYIFIYKYIVVLIYVFHILYRLICAQKFCKSVPSKNVENY